MKKIIKMDSTSFQQFVGEALKITRTAEEHEIILHLMGALAVRYHCGPLPQIRTLPRENGTNTNRHRLRVILEVQGQVDQVSADDEPKSLGWKSRSWVGTKQKWYAEVEEDRGVLRVE
jgi:hypothetical protein